jgi:hypothetical protein
MTRQVITPRRHLTASSAATALIAALSLGPLTGCQPNKHTRLITNNVGVSIVVCSDEGDAFPIASAESLSVDNSMYAKVAGVFLADGTNVTERVGDLPVALTHNDLKDEPPIILSDANGATVAALSQAAAIAPIETRTSTSFQGRTQKSLVPWLAFCADLTTP